jgi:hypothetical protein
MRAWGRADRYAALRRELVEAFMARRFADYGACCRALAEMRKAHGAGDRRHATGATPARREMLGWASRKRWAIWRRKRGKRPLRGDADLLRGPP